MKSKRQKALEWWDWQPFYSFNNMSNKINFFNWYKENHFTPANNYSQLTSREIEIIYKHFKLNDNEK